MKTSIFLRAAISIFMAYMTIPTILVAQDGSLDLSFDTDGIALTHFGASQNFCNAFAFQSDGKIVATGFTFSGSVTLIALVRYNVDGSLDTSFDNDGKVTTDIGSIGSMGEALKIQADGKIIVAGKTNNGSIYDFLVLRYNTNGGLDSTFDSDGIKTLSLGILDSRARSLEIQPDGKILVAGAVTNILYNEFAVIRLNSDGSLDNTFDLDGIVTTTIGTSDADLEDMVLQTDGKIILTGTSEGIPNGDITLARYNSDGTLDNTFDTDGIVTTNLGAFDEGVSVIVQGDGRIIVAGCTNSAGQGEIALVRYNQNGSLDNTFDSDGIVTTSIGTNHSYGLSVAVQSDGKIIVSGYTSSPTNDILALVRYLSDGSLDNTFDTDGIVSTMIGAFSYGTTVHIQTDGKIVASGFASNSGTDYDFALARYNITPTVIKETKNEPTSISLFPNPFSTSANIQFNATINDGELCIYNISGEKVKTINNIHGQSMIIYREHLEKSHYIIKLTEEHKLLAQGVIEIVD